MKKAGIISSQRGSILLVAMVSILVIGTVAAGLNVLRRQDVDTATQTIEAMRSVSVWDFAKRMGEPENEVRKVLYEGSE